MVQENSVIIPDEIIADKIYLVRGEKVMPDQDLPILYGVENKRPEQVRGNLQRFPNDFMFQLNQEEWNGLKSPIATLKKRKRKSFVKLKP